MKKTKKRRFRIWWLWIAFAVYELIGLTLPCWSHTVRESNRESWNITAEAMANAVGEAPEKIAYVGDNNEALAERLWLMEQAKETLFMAIFEMHDDEAGADMLSGLYAAADRGVKVRLLVDGTCLFYNLLHTRDFRTLSSHENVEVKVYNPLFLHAPWRINYRMHDKYILVDDTYFLISGRNISSAFFGDYVEESAKKHDRDFVVMETEPGKGRAYKQLRLYAEAVWNLDCCQFLSLPGDGGKELLTRYQEKRLANPYEGPETFFSASLCLYSNPAYNGYKDPLLWNEMAADMHEGSDILLQTPYLVCSNEMYETLQMASSTARQLDVLINAAEGGSNPVAGVDYLNYRENVLSTGVNVYEYLGDYPFHSKLLLVDDEISYVGSCNSDIRSVYLDTELMLRVESPEMNRLLKEEATRYQDRSRYTLANGTTGVGSDYQDVLVSRCRAISLAILQSVMRAFRHLA